MSTNSLSTAESFEAIAAAINLINAKYNTKLAHFHTQSITDGYITLITDRDLEQQITAANSDQSASFTVNFNYDLFTDNKNDEIDGLADVKIIDSLDIKAKKRCAYIIFNAYDLFKKDFKLITKDFLLNEIKAIIRALNKAQKLNINLVAWQPDGDDLKIYITEKSINQDSENPNTYLYVSPSYYTEEDTTIDDQVGIQNIKYGPGSWKYNGRLRLAWILFNTLKYWLANKHKDAYKKLAGK